MQTIVGCSVSFLVIGRNKFSARVQIYVYNSPYFYLARMFAGQYWTPKPVNQSAPQSSNAKAAHVPWHQAPGIRALLFQVAVGAALAWGIYWLITNIIANMAARGKFVSFSFIDDVAPFGVGFAPFWNYTLGQSNYWEVFVIAIQNTILVSVSGIIAATFLGFILGIARLSPNWIVRKIARVYIETFRNVPLLLQIFFWYVAVFLPVLPSPRESWTLGTGFALNKEGVYLPRPLVESASGFVVYCLIVLTAIVAVGLLIRWARRRQERTGLRLPLLWTVPTLVGIAVGGYFVAGSPLTLESPELKKFIHEGGLNLSTSFVVMWVALSTYTAAFIGENVRGGILSVSHGQTEAAHALGLWHGVTLRRVIIPQAMRVITPPTISQYLNLTKNSSLSIAVAYEELSALWIGVSLSQTGQEFLIIASAMAVYLTLSLLTSGFLNGYNKRMQIKDR